MQDFIWKDFNKTEKAILIVLFKHWPNSLTTQQIEEQIFELKLLEMSDKELDKFNDELRLSKIN